MPGSPKKRDRIAKKIKSGEMPPMKDALKRYGYFIHTLLESAMLDCDKMSSAARVSMADKIASIISKMRDMGLEQLDEDGIREIGIPVIMLPTKEDKDET